LRVLGPPSAIPPRTACQRVVSVACSARCESWWCGGANVEKAAYSNLPAMWTGRPHGNASRIGKRGRSVWLPGELPGNGGYRLLMPALAGCRRARPVGVDAG
jgi:hypothetical protein